MREIQFRAWCDDGYGEARMEYDLKQATVQECGLNYLIQYMIGSQGYTLMQYTGLTDKNGAEIYLSDLLRVNGKVFQVKWDDGAAMFFIQASDDEAYGFPVVCEVIGNIYENPELIGGTVEDSAGNPNQRLSKPS